MSDILSFVIPPIDSEPYLEPMSEEKSIWSNLQNAVEKQVKSDGIKKDSIQPGQLESDVSDYAVAEIYHDVAEFYNWYFDHDDDRYRFLRFQKSSGVPSWLKDAVKPVVDENLDAMRKADEIPPGEDVHDLSDHLTDALSRYIINWQDWFYDRKREEELDDYFEQKSFNDDIYYDSDYGDLTNIVDPDGYDGISDVPYLTKEMDAL